MPSGLKNKMVNLHATTTKVKIDQTIRPLLIHTVPPCTSSEKYSIFVWGEDIVLPPLPTLTGLEEEAKKPLLLLMWEMNQSTAKINKYD